jgi:hypothetical protein
MDGDDGERSLLMPPGRGVAARAVARRVWHWRSSAVWPFSSPRPRSSGPPGATSSAKCECALPASPAYGNECAAVVGAVVATATNAIPSSGHHQHYRCRRHHHHSIIIIISSSSSLPSSAWPSLGSCDVLVRWPQVLHAWRTEHAITIQVRTDAIPATVCLWIVWYLMITPLSTIFSSGKVSWGLGE